jgi:hypothetical protein
MFVILLSSTAWLFIGLLAGDLNWFLRIALILIGILPLLVMPKRDTYLPFLGDMALPSSALSATKLEGNVLIQLVNLPPNSKVIYWAANPGTDPKTSPKKAYAGHFNGGVSITDNKGTAQIAISCPQNYTVNRFGIDKVLPKHVHFRYELPDKNGLFSRIETKLIDSQMCSP